MTNTPITASYNLSSTQSDQAGKAGCLLFGVAGAGKSTLIEHLPYSARSLFDDQLTLLNATELEQDTPANTTSHPALALFQANVAIVIVDASLGLPDQCRQFIQQIALLGINELILAVNKMDLVGYSENTFLKLANDFQQLASQAGLENITVVPISALENVNVTETGKNLPWYQGRVLKDQLQQLQTKAVASAASTVRNARESHANQFESTIIWLNPQPLLPGRRYLLETGTQTTSATITTIKHRLNVGAPELLAAKKLDCSAAGVCNISVDQQIAFMPYQESHESGGFILIDAASNQLAGVGMLHFALRRAQNIHLHKLDVDKAARASKLGHQPCVLWFTGLSGSGKSTIANMAEKKLYAQGFHTYMLDGDNVRHGLNKDLGFTDADRVENIRRIAEVAKLMVDAGLIVLVAFISPFRSDRDRARELLQKGEFVEVFIDTPLAVAEERDPKGLYQKARKGELKNFTGIDSPYEPPLNPEIRIDTTVISADQAADLIVSRIQENNR